MLVALGPAPASAGAPGTWWAVDVDGDDGTPLASCPADAVAGLVADLTGRDITAAGRAADGKPLGIAVALDHAVIPRSRWSDTLLEANQTVEIVTAVQGG